MRQKVIVLFIFCGLLFSESSIGQQYRIFTHNLPADTLLHIELQSLNMAFRLPYNFHQDSVADYVCGNGYLMSAVSYGLINKSNNIVVLMIFIDRNWVTPEKTAMLRKITPGYDPEKNYLVGVRLESDTSYRIIHYPPSYIRKTSRADDAGEYVLNCPNAYKKIYTHCKVVFMHKEKRGDVSLYYFYTDAAKKKINRCIKKTAPMLRYN